MMLHYTKYCNCHPSQRWTPLLPIPAGEFSICGPTTPLIESAGYANPLDWVRRICYRLEAYKNSYLHFIDPWAAVAVYTLLYTSLAHAHQGKIIGWSVPIYNLGEQIWIFGTCVFLCALAYPCNNDTILLCLGVTPAQSALILKQWLDEVALSVGIPFRCLTYSKPTLGTRIFGEFDSMRGPECARFEEYLHVCGIWCAYTGSLCQQLIVGDMGESNLWRHPPVHSHDPVCRHVHKSCTAQIVKNWLAHGILSENITIRFLFLIWVFIECSFLFFDF